MIMTIPGTMPNLNDMINDARTNKFKSAAQKHYYTEMVAFCAKKARIPKLKRVGLNITWYERNKRRDPDGVQSGGLKYIWDGLVMAGVLENDGWGQQGQVVHTMAVDKNNPRVVVELVKEG